MKPPLPPETGRGQEIEQEDLLLIAAAVAIVGRWTPEQSGLRSLTRDATRIFLESQFFAIINLFCSLLSE